MRQAGRFEPTSLPSVRASRASLPFGFLAFILLFAAIFLGWVVIAPYGASGQRWFSDLSLTTIAVGGGGLSMLLAYRMPMPDRRSWLLIGAGTFAWGLGMVAWTYDELVLQQKTPFPSLADLGYLTLIPLMFAGLITFPGVRLRTEERIKTGVDAFIVIATIATISWYLLLGPIYSQAGASTPQKVIGSIYPAGDVLLICALVGGMARGWLGRWDPSMVALIIGIVLFSIADLGFNFLTLHNSYASGHPIDLGWPLGFLFITYATVHRWAYGIPSRDQSPSGKAESWWLARLASWAPYILVAGIAGLLLYGHVGQRGVVGTISVVLSLSTMLLVLARQYITLRENKRLNQELRSFSQELEALVGERTARLTMLQQLASALSAAGSTTEVCRLGLTALRQSVDGTGAIFYMSMADANAWVAIAGEPTLPPQPVDVPAALRTDMLQKDVLCCEDEGADGDRHGTVWVPVVARGESFGCIGIFGACLQPPPDTQMLLTIGAEFGVAYENHRRFEEAKRQADLDPVTGLHNHRSFHAHLEQALADARPDRTPCALVLVDIDDFKLFNDTYGHAVGDEILKLVADGLRGHCPAGGVAARFGGDEFALVLPGHDDAGASDAIRRMQRWAGQQAFQQRGGERIPVRLSFGYALFPDQATRRHELVSLADARLYEAKRSGDSAPCLARAQESLHPTGTFPFLEALVTSIDNKDQYTKRHCDLVSEYAVLIAQGLGLSAQVQRSLAIAGALHDVGKLCIPDHILRKPGPLNAEEYEIIKRHVPMAETLIQNVPWRKDVLDAVVHHHERVDGKGYVRGLKGDEIPLLGRIMTVADAFSAMTLDRPYRKALALDYAMAELRTYRGTQFDGDVVDVFARELERRLHLQSQSQSIAYGA